MAIRKRSDVIRKRPDVIRERRDPISVQCQRKCESRPVT
jgi:hypothetical protein